MQGAGIIVVGGGAIGLSVAYHLARAGADDVLLLERNELTSGTSWHAAGIIGPLRATPSLTRLAMRAPALFGELETETGQATGYARTGGCWLAGSAERLRELAGLADIGACMGLGARLLSPAELGERFSQLRVDDLHGALWVDEDGQANPVDLCMAYARGARARGVRIEQNARVCAIARRGRRVSGVTLHDGRKFACATLINCAGAWAPAVAALLDEPLAVQAVAHMYLVTGPVPGLPAPCPIVRDLDAGIYLKGDAGRLVLGGFEADARALDAGSAALSAPYAELPEDWEQFEPFMRAGLHRLPLLGDAGVQRFLNGPEGFTPDTRPLFGRVPGLDGCYVAAGFNSLGIVSSAGIGQAMAETVLDGRPAFDLWEIDAARLDGHSAAPAYLRERMREAVADQFAMHWPGKLPVHARGQRRSVLHDRLAAAGAVYGQLGGWERPLWFARNAHEHQIDYGYGAQRWWSYAAREGRAAAEAVVLFDLSPFAKFDLRGPGARATLERLCAGDLDLPPGCIRYTQMLNEDGGIEADVTVWRTGEQAWRVVSGAATRVKDLEWIARHAGEDAVVFDATSAEAVIGVMGPCSRELLQALSDSDLGAAAFGFGATRVIDIAMARVRAVRVSFIGELGYELYCPSEVAAHVYEQIVRAGAGHGLAHAGLYCLDGCRLEKGHPHWSHDIGADVSPLEAGLGFCVDWERADGFIGGEALLAQRARGVPRRRVLLEVPYEGTPPLLLADQPVYFAGAVAGMTTSAALGPRTGRALAMALLDAGAGGPDFEIACAGERRRACLLERPPYDADGERLRA